MFQKAIKYYDKRMLSSDSPFDMRVYNLVYFCAWVACVLGHFSSVIRGKGLMVCLILFGCSAVLFLIGFFFNVINQFRVGSIILAVLSLDIFIPVAYFTNGGIRGGATAYIVLGIVVTMVVFDSRDCVVVLFTFFATMATCVAVNYYHPELVTPLSYGHEYFDKAYPVLLCGVALGFMAKLQKLVYDGEKKETEAAMQAKAEFLAAISHEIRTPLNAILGLAEVELQQALPQDTHSNLEKVRDSGNALLNIVNDILDTAKIESGRFTLTALPYDVPSLLNDTIALNLAKIGAKPITLRVDVDESIPISLKGDETRIRQILNRLLASAFKFTDSGGVRLSVRQHSNKEGFWLDCSISFASSGLSPENIRHLFKNGASGEGSPAKTGGTGLGLDVCKNLVEMMGGTIKAESEEGARSALYFSVKQEVADPTPIGRDLAYGLTDCRFAHNQQSRSEKLTPARYPDARVLVVDDVATNLDVAKGLLLRYGMAIDLADSGKKAVEIVREGRVKYDAIFMDHMMPEMDGIETVRLIRNEIGTDYAKNVPIIALTANALSGNKEMFLKNGFQAFLSKPIDPYKLDAAITAWIGNGQSDENKATPQNEGGGSPLAARLLGQAIEGLDIKKGLERFGGSAETYLEVLKSYHRNTPPLLGKLKNPSADTLKDYTITAHGIKGSSLAIQAGAVGQSAAELEALGKAGDIQAISAKNEAFISSAEAFIEKLGELIKTAAGTQNAEKPLAAEPDKALLAKMAQAVASYDIKEIESCMAELEKHQYAKGQDDIAWLREQVDKLEYENIKKKLSLEQNK